MRPAPDPGGRLRALAGRLSRLAGPLTLCAVIAAGLALTAPLVAGAMPRSADHPVHLTRIWLFGQVLADGQLRGWSDLWFFGMPAGELYPPLGDLVVVLLRALTLGLASWQACYAWMVAGVFTLQGVALWHAGRALGRGPLPGLVAGLLALVDAGAYREGGWTYTMLYGVWPQALATSLAVICVTEAARARAAAAPAVAQRRLAVAALAGGGALLAHPMSLPSLALAALPGLWLLARIGPGEGGASDRSPGTGSGADDPGDADRSPGTGAGATDPVDSDRSPGTGANSPVAGADGNVHSDRSKGRGTIDPASAPPQRAAPARPRLGEAAADLALVALLAVGVAAWWLWPMIAHRGWMASYGWLHAPLDAMTRMALEGRFTQHMPSAVGWAIWLGLGVTLLRGPALARLFGAWALGQWLLASADAFWALRLDHLSAGFAHVQFQRFLIAAKPGLFLLAGVGVAALPRALARVARSRLRAHLRWPIAVTLGGALILLGGGVIEGTRAAMRAHHVGEPQLARFPDHPGRDGDYAALLAWLRGRAGAGEGGRVAFRAHRNAHWFMDSPLVTGAPTYKLGFTPGDNFVHKPEAGGEALLDRLGVRWLVSVGGGRSAAARFGEFTVRDRGAPGPRAHLEGPGSLEIIDGDPSDGEVRVRVRGAAAGATRLVLHVAGYPRWELRQEGAPLEWIEVPAVGDGPPATVQARRRGELRGGKAGGDDGSEPTLIAATVGDGEVVATYVRWRWFDVAGLVASLAALAAIVALARGRRRPLVRLRALGARALRPWVLALALVLAVVVLGARWLRADAAEAGSAHAWLAAGRAVVEAPVHAIRPGPLKSDMLVRPAILVRARGEGEASIVFPGVALGEQLRGRAALDDDAAQGRRRGGHRLRIDARPAGGGEWVPLADQKLLHRPGSVELALAPGALAGRRVDLRVRVASSGEAPPPMGLALELGEPPAP